MKLSLLIVTMMVGTVLALGTPAWSDKKKHEDGDISAMAKDATVTIEQAIKTAVEKVPGTVVEAELEKKHGKTGVGSGSTGCERQGDRSAHRCCDWTRHRHRTQR